MFKIVWNFFNKEYFFLVFLLPGGWTSRVAGLKVLNGPERHQHDPGVR